MLYLKSLSIDRFKSFKHVSLLFNKGFNCVVGPNGSGKSNICDAILFGLGESSLHRMRVNRLEYLIHSSGKKSGPLAKAHVRLEFDGDEQIKILRAVRADGKTVYRLNGKHMTRQEVLEVLKKHAVHVDETSTITQGEINKLIDLNPKERKELIELAAGIKEFEFKKNEAMSELAKVGAKVSEAEVMLNERLGFLQELEKEKVSAESYVAMSKRLKALNYSVLSKRKEAVIATLNTYAKDLTSLEEKRKKAELDLAALTGNTSKLSEERQKLTKILSDSSSSMGDINKRLESIGGEIGALEVKISNATSDIEELEKRLTGAKDEAKSLDERMRSNDSEITALKLKVEALDASAKKIGTESAGAGLRSVDKVRSDGEALQKLEREIEKLHDAKAKLNSELLLEESNKANLTKNIASIRSEIDDLKKKISDSTSRAKDARSRKEQSEIKLIDAEEASRQANKELSRLDSELIELKERKAMSRSRDSQMQERLKNAFGKSAGFYGTAAELCSYDEKYAAAVEAAAGGRFSYFVVESIDVANVMIDYLRKQNLGRATFIPIQELNIREEKDGREPEAEPVLSVLVFDEKFAKAFTYIFGDTYLVESVDVAKKIGIGRHRYATMSGETVEKSGVLAGGSAPKSVPVAVIERKIAELDKARQQLYEESRSMGDTIFEYRKAIASAEMEISSSNSIANDYDSRLRNLESQTANAQSDVEKAEADSKRLAKENEELELELKAKSEQLNTERAAFVKSYDETLKESVMLAKSGHGKEDLERLDSLRKEIESNRIRSAEIQKENNMLANSSDTLVAEIGEKKDLLQKVQQSLSLDTKKKADLEKSKEHIQQEISESSKSNKGAYERLSSIEAEMLSLSSEQGKLNAGIEDITRRENEIDVRKGQMDVRLNDIKAELAAYGEMDSEMIKGDAEKMEKEANVLSVKIAELGNVNLKAPEIYEEKRKSVDEATEKVNTLEAERRAIISMMEEIDSKKMNAFIATFNEINKNFSKLYTYIFPGTARIDMEKIDDPLNGGIEIKIESGKNFRRIGSMSGGERSLISLMLIFAIHMCKPSSIYLFDEIDAALDKENSKKLSQLIKELSKNAQFIVVSHNDSLIFNSDAAIGVVKTEDESKVVGLEVSKVRNEVVSK